MKPFFEKLIPRTGESFRCFDRSTVKSVVRWHRHHEIELTYVPRGDGTRVIGDCIDRYTDHDLVLSGSQLPHSWKSDDYQGKKYDRHQAFVLQFSPEYFGDQVLTYGEMNDVIKLLRNSSRGLWFPEETAIGIGRQMRSLVTAKGAKRLIGLLSILHDLSQCTDAVPLGSPWYGAHSTSPTSDPTEAKIRQVCDYVTDHLTDPELSQRQLAALVDMNPSAFGRFFKQVVGRTPAAYISELKISLACRLLIDTEDSVLSICHRSGFANLSNFNRRFRQHREMTPRDYRIRFRDAS
ncbi:helix-turn-helix domain-containing protein [Rhodopirellula sp. SWK7]|uniref:helix-turn-helix domain-containing protein n=1 Tax=Rhodopirellula sp. SWK7 TaxID=595460 RepID=UPI0002BFB22B|nr:AraC family transcriptional regulator [Rhodopirellula sp. SWK7]EMI43463.1 transcriptional regulator, AraC family protein [Rhodopirellula sp. SWK7]